MKHCNGCNRDLPLAMFAKRSDRPSGVQSRCRECSREASAKRYTDADKRAAMLERNRLWRHDHDDYLSEYGAARREAARARRPARYVPPAGFKVCKKCSAEKPLSEYHNMAGTADGKHVYCKPCNLQHSREWWASNAERGRATVRAYEAAHPERVREWRYATTMRYWARRRGATLGHVTSGDIAARWAMWGDRCYICGADAEATDHVIPLSRGGLHTPANLRPVCGHCNSVKGGRDWRAFTGGNRMSEVTNG